MAIRFLSKNTPLPQLYPKVVRKNPTVNDAGYDMVGDFKLRDHVDYMPQRGMQEKACACNSNLIFLCGESQMGKTYLMLLAMLKGYGKVNYTGRFISVRLQDSKKGSSILRDAIAVLGNFSRCEYNISDYPTFYWERWNISIQFIHSNFNVANPKEWDAFKDYAKKNQASRFCIDEATEMKDFKMFSYWFSRNRDDSGETPQMILSFNYEHEHFTTTMLKDAGYLGDDWYFKPEMNGVTRYFYIAGDTENDIIWGNTAEEVAQAAHITITKKERRAGVTINQIVKSCTVFTGESADNLKLISATKGQNIGNLHNTGATQRAILKSGYAGPVDKDELCVSRQMIHDMWINPISDDENMYATMDVSGGNAQSDSCPMVIWRGLRIIAIKLFRGDAKELVSWIADTLAQYNVPVQNFAFDATGLGYYLKAYTQGMPIVANKAAMKEFDVDGNPVVVEQYFNLRSQLLGKTKVMLERGDISCALDKSTMLTYGRKNEQRQLIDILFDERNIFVVTTRNKKIYYRSKDEYKSKFKGSPDLFDAISYRAVFELDGKPKKRVVEVSADAYDSLYSDDFDTDFFDDEF
jgi:hypothetical protein